MNNIVLNFTHFDTELDYDVLFVYDGTEDNGQPVKNISGYNSSPFFTSATSIHLKFTTDSSKTAKGFRIEVRNTPGKYRNIHYRGWHIVKNS